jgi:membrane associated rhomboid family serine protease
MSSNTRRTSDTSGYTISNRGGKRPVIPPAQVYVIPIKDDVPVSRTPIVTISLISSNVVAFLWQLGVVGLPLSVQIAGVIPYEVLTLRDLRPPNLVPPPLTLLTSMFLHGGFMHIAGNMLFLWIFGNNVEDALGKGRFLMFYCASGVAAALAQIGLSALDPDPTAMFIPMVGASGAIAGVLAGYMLLFPRARVLTLVFILFLIRLVYVPAGFFIGLWFAIQLLNAVLGSTAGGVAFMAHVGGFVTGFVLMKLVGPSRRWKARRYAP